MIFPFAVSVPYFHTMWLVLQMFYARSLHMIEIGMTYVVEDVGMMVRIRGNTLPS